MVGTACDWKPPGTISLGGYESPRVRKKTDEEETCGQEETRKQPAGKRLAIHSLSPMVCVKRIAPSTPTGMALVIVSDKFDASTSGPFVPVCVCGVGCGSVPRVQSMYPPITPKSQYAIARLGNNPLSQESQLDAYL